MNFNNKSKKYAVQKINENTDGKYETRLIFLNAKNILVRDAFLDGYLSKNKIVQFIQNCVPQNVLFMLQSEQYFKISFNVLKMPESGNLLDFQCRIEFRDTGNVDGRYIAIELSNYINQDHWIIKGLERYFPTNRSVTELFLLNDTLGREPRSMGRPKILEYLGLYEGKTGKKTQSGGIIRPRS